VAFSQKEHRGTPLENWVDSAARLTKPTYYLLRRFRGGNERMIAEMLREGDSVKLTKKRTELLPPSQQPNDVARTEHLTFICTPEKSDAGPTNNGWIPTRPSTKSRAVDGAMRGRSSMSFRTSWAR